jgi:hypothetical protein
MAQGLAGYTIFSGMSDSLSGLRPPEGIKSRGARGGEKGVVVMPTVSPALEQAVAYVEKLQAEALRSPYPKPNYYELGFHTEERARFRRDEFSEQCKQLFSTSAEEDQDEVPLSRFEDRNWFTLTSRIAADIEKADSAEGNTKHVLFATLPTGDINGSAINFSNPEYYVVAIDDGVFTFAMLLSKSLAQIFDGSESNGSLSLEFDSIDSKVPRNSTFFFRMSDLVLSYIVGGHPEAAIPYLLPDRIGTQTMWTNVIEYFIIGHEIGHARLKHLERQLNRRMIDRDYFQEIPLDWQQEFEADEFGVWVTLRCLSHIYRPSDVDPVGGTTGTGFLIGNATAPTS